MKNLAFISLFALALTGCATSKDYQLYAETQQKIAHANAMAETARYAALAEIAKSGDSASKVAAVMSLNMGTGQGNKLPQQVLAPKSAGDTALQWTSVLLPGLTQFYGINANRQIAITQSNNAAAIAQSTNNTFANMNSAGHNANVSIAGQGFNAVTDVAKTGIGQVGTTAGAGFDAVTAVSASSNASIQAISATIPQIQPNVTTNTTTTNNNTTTTP
jgi:hypothetical protein